jgi:transposase
MQTSNTCPPITGHSGTIFVAIELSQKSWLVTLWSPDRDRISRQKLPAGDGGGVVGLIERTKARAERALGWVPAVVSCYEAGYDGFWLHRLLAAAGIENFVFDPASIAIDQRARRAKTDRIDGELLLRTLMGYRRGEPRVVRVVQVPAVEAEDVRRTSRERKRLVKERVAHINRIKGLLRLVGLPAGQPRRADWVSWLEQQRDWQGEPVPSHLMAELKREHARLLLLNEQLEALAKAPGPADQPIAATIVQRRDLLCRLRGIGPAIAGTLAHEVFYKDFRNRREVGSYVGLCPSPWRSGGIAREQGISKAGNPRARTTSIELAWLWVLHQPDSALTQEFHQRTANASKRIRRIAIVALARKLIVALWRYVTIGLVPEKAVLKQAA